MSTVSPAQLRTATVQGYVRLIRDRYELNKALEKAVCRCSPLREKRDRIRKRIDSGVSAILRKAEDEVKKQLVAKFGEKMCKGLPTHVLDNPYWARDILVRDRTYKRLSKRISEFDQVDHKKAHELHDFAVAYARAWVLEQLDKGKNLPFDKTLLDLYAKDIARGWEPSFPEKRRKT